MSSTQTEALQDFAEKTQSDGLPSLILPGNGQTITACAEQLFGLIAPTHELFNLGGRVVKVFLPADGVAELNLLSPPRARSVFEKFALVFAWRAGGPAGQPVLKQTVYSDDMARALLESDEAKKILPSVRGLANCAVIREHEGKLEVVANGYDPVTRLFITNATAPPTVPLSEAVPAIKSLFEQVFFQTEGDRARAVASLFGPALRMGGLLKGRVPADTAEADQSQSGKTYRQKVEAAVYGERLSLVTQREGGVGSVDESFSQALVKGRPFIQFDNFRGAFNSPSIESFFSAEVEFPCRIPHQGTIHVNPEAFFVMLTSNGVNTTRDFANRSNIIRIKKAPAGFEFKKFPEGDLLDHVRVRQAYYLACVFAIIREWHRRGKPRTAETRHDFRDWVQVLDWICQNLIGTVPIMDGHQQAQERVSNPAQVWLRQWVLAAVEAKELNRPLTASNVFEICEGAGIAIPGQALGVAEAKGRKMIGVHLGKIFRDGDTFSVDGWLITRSQMPMPRANPADGGAVFSKTYTISPCSENAAATQSPQQGV